MSNELSSLTTIRDYLRWTVSQMHSHGVYFGHGYDNAWDEALALLAFSLHLGEHLNSDVLDATILPTERRIIVENVARRCERREPLAYITQNAWFAELPFHVTSDVLIPRSPLAEMIEQQFSPWWQTDQPILRILDVGTGSGCIACACAYHCPDSVVDAVDISPGALAIAERNANALELTSRMQFIHSDMFSGLSADARYDVVISNPPYVDAANMAALPAEYHHEPRHALTTSEAGLNLIDTLLAKAAQYLKPSGLLIVEVGEAEYAVRQRYPMLDFTWLDFQRGGDGVFLLQREQLISGQRKDG